MVLAENLEKWLKEWMGWVGAVVGDWLVGWLVGGWVVWCLVGWLVACLLAWLVGWLVGWVDAVCWVDSRPSICVDGEGGHLLGLHTCDHCSSGNLRRAIKHHLSPAGSAGFAGLGAEGTKRENRNSLTG